MRFVSTTCLVGRRLCTFIPLFVFRELRRAMGEANFSALTLRSPATPNVKPSEG